MNPMTVKAFDESKANHKTSGKEPRTANVIFGKMDEALQNMPYRGIIAFLYQ